MLLKRQLYVIPMVLFQCGCQEQEDSCRCSRGVCSSLECAQPAEQVCTVDSECDDSIACSKDQCLKGFCVHTSEFPDCVPPRSNGGCGLFVGGCNVPEPFSPCLEATENFFIDVLCDTDADCARDFDIAERGCVCSPHFGVCVELAT